MPVRISIWLLAGLVGSRISPLSARPAAMLGVKMKTDSRAFVTYLRDHGLLTVAAGDNVMRVLPPLNIAADELDEGLAILEESLGACCGCRCPGHQCQRPDQAIRGYPGRGRCRSKARSRSR